MDIMGMIGKMKEMQGRMAASQAAIAKFTTTADTGAGTVTATISGQRRVISLRIDPDLSKGMDAADLQVLTIAAINKGLENMDEMIKTHMESQTKDLIPNIPGLDLGSLLGR